MKGSMHWTPSRPLDEIPVGTWVTVRARCTCGVELGQRCVQMPAEGVLKVPFRVPGPLCRDGWGIVHTVYAEVHWTRPAPRWQPQHP